MYNINIIHPLYILDLGPLSPVHGTLLVTYAPFWVKFGNVGCNDGACCFPKWTLSEVSGLCFGCIPRTWHGRRVSLWWCASLCLLICGTWQMGCLSSTTTIPEVWWGLRWFYSLPVPSIFWFLRKSTLVIPFPHSIAHPFWWASWLMLGLRCRPCQRGICCAFHALSHWWGGWGPSCIMELPIWCSRPRRPLSWIWAVCCFWCIVR